MNDIGIAGWLFNRRILRDKTMTQLDLPVACREIGVETIELVSSFFPSQTAPYLNDLRVAISDAGCQVKSIAVDMGDIASADEARRRTDIEAIKQWFFTARAIGSEAIRVNSGNAEPDDEAAIDRIVEGYRELAAEAEHADVYLLIENHGGASNDPANVEAFLTRVGSPWFRTCPDTGNFADGTWETGMRVMAPAAFSCHIKLSVFSEDGWQPMEGGDGKDRGANLKRSLQIMKEANYQGPLCIESVPSSSDEIAGAREAIRYVREMVASI